MSAMFRILFVSDDDASKGERSQELFSEDLCDEGYAGKKLSLADTQHQSPDVGASWRPLWEVDHVLEA